ncbi:cytochrome P450 [Nocardioides sp.]|uniref:cytochrome P450 n=1 Tax=Nocardioides sp. TaxID=35761 RepID=UPI003218F6EA
MSTPTRRQVALDINGVDYQRRPLEQESKARDAGAVAWTESNGGHWMVSRHQAVLEGLREAENYSTEKFVKDDGELGGGIMIPTVPFYRYLPNEADPPSWNVYRRSIAPHLSPGSVEKLAPVIERYTTEIIDAMIEAGECDFVMEVGSPITAKVTLHILGLPTDDWYFYASAVHRLFADSEAAGPGIEAVQERLASTIAERRAQPGSGMIDDLIATDVNGAPMSDEDVKDLVFDVIVGGFDTVAGLLAGALQWLQDQPEAKARLLVDDRFLQTATEEFLRFVSPAVGLSRTAKRDYTIGDQMVAEGDRIYFMYRSANRDPEEFTDPETVDLERRPNRHVAFGAGIHRCVGSNLARAIFQSVVRQFLTRVPDYQVVEAEQYKLTNNNAGFARMVMQYSPGQPSTA